MKMKLSSFAAIAIGLVVMFVGAPAHAEISYLRDFAGWEAATHPDGTIRVARTDRPIQAASIYLYPTIETPVTTQEEAQSLMESIKKTMAARHKQCTPIGDNELKPNGMGLSVQDRETAPKCVLWISSTKQGHLFANLRLDDGTLNPQSLPAQQTARVFIVLTGARMQGEEFLITQNGEVDLKQFVRHVPENNVPARMVIAHWPALKYVSTTRYKAIPLLKNQTASSCSNWDPSFFSPAYLAKVKAKPSSALEEGQCKLLVWKKDLDTNDIVFSNGAGLKPARDVIGADILATRIEPFAKGEKLNVRFGSLSRMQKVVLGKADIRTLEAGDIILAGDGTFRAEEIALANLPLHLPKEMSGRYYLDGHIIVLELDSGPILVGFGGKVETGGKVTGLFLGGSAYGDIQ